eukprot:TRINITY_DN4558_c0_g1_i1.p2 TRINITY_DN4558_c0_g1~~TRINITY_DN4558_c0_g1_i1.p2  ORF type:complete len:136 (-),score=47.96 TRINITY_DN4558_c0_g1_i1:147-554(-)
MCIRDRWYQRRVHGEKKKKLREVRFQTGANTASTLEAEKIMEQELQKQSERAKRFGIPDPTDEELKKQKRAERFGTSGELTPSEENKKKEERAKRFGLSTPQEQEEKLKMRLAKFGPNTASEPGALPQKKFKKSF